MVRLRNIAEPYASRVVHAKVQTILERRQEVFDNLSAEIEADRDDPDLLQEVVDEMKCLQVELEIAQRNASRLNLEFASILKEFVEKAESSPHPLVNLARRRLTSASKLTAEDFGGLAHLEAREEVSVHHYSERTADWQDKSIAFPKIDLQEGPTSVAVKQEEAGSIDSVSWIDVKEDRDKADGKKSREAPLKTSKIATSSSNKKEWGLLGRLMKSTSSRAKTSTAPSEKPTEKIDLHPEDCVIILLGPSGSGKSTFISIAVGANVGIGGDLWSCTSAISTFRLPPAVEGSPMACLGDTKVVLVDTPGFDDTNKPDYEIFEMVAKWLKNVSLNSLGIAGIIYLHRISDNRMAGTPLKNLNMFRELCGKKIMTNATLMTTMWADTMPEDAVRREHELKGKHFKQFIRLGATIARFNDDQASVATILEPLVNTWRNTQDEDRILSMVRLQKEVIIYHLDIAETSAARVVRGKVQAIPERRQEVLDKLANQIDANRDDPELLQEIMGEMTRLQGELEEVQRDADRLHLEFASHLKMFMTKVIRRTHPLINLAQRRLPSHTNPTPGSSPVG